MLFLNRALCCLAIIAAFSLLADAAKNETEPVKKRSSANNPFYGMGFKLVGHFGMKFRNEVKSDRKQSRMPLHGHGGRHYGGPPHRGPPHRGPHRGGPPHGGPPHRGPHRRGLPHRGPHRGGQMRHRGALQRLSKSKIGRNGKRPRRWVAELEKISTNHKDVVRALCTIPKGVKVLINEKHMKEFIRDVQSKKCRCRCNGDVCQCIIRSHTRAGKKSLMRFGKGKLLMRQSGRGQRKGIVIGGPDVAYDELQK